MGKRMHGMMDEYCSRTGKAQETKTAKRGSNRFTLQVKTHRNLAQNTEVACGDSLCALIFSSCHQKNVLNVFTGPGHPIIIEFVGIFPCVIMMEAAAVLQGFGWVRVRLALPRCHIVVDSCPSSGLELI